MTDLTFVDAANASTITGGPYNGVCFYIGGDAAHVWSVTDLEQRPEQYALPTWVRSNPTAVNPVMDAANCLQQLAQYKVPNGSLVALDSETSIDPSWVKAFVGALNAGGYRVIDYGSQSTVFGNDNPDGYYWGADWTNVPHLASGDQITQFKSTTGDDISEAEPTLPFWNRKPTVASEPEVTSGNQPDWAWCKDCQNLAFAPKNAESKCAGNMSFELVSGALVLKIGPHNISGSWDYSEAYSTKTP